MLEQYKINKKIAVGATSELYLADDPERGDVAVKVLRYLQSRDWDTVHVLQLKRPLHRELEKVMGIYLSYILERNLKSVDFLHRLRREGALFAGPENGDS